MNYVNLTIHNTIGTVEFFTEQSNSLPGEILSKLAKTITEAGQDANINVIILKSGGDRAFCAGASFDELLAVDNAESGKRFFMGFANVINAIRTVPKFVIGRIQGKAVGGGIGLASAVDYCFATKYASIKLSELALGIGPFIVSAPIERKMGLSAMSQLAVQPDTFFTPDWCKSNGLFAEVFEEAEAMDAALAKLAEKLAGYNPEAMAEMKKVFWRNCDNWDNLLEDRARISGELVLSDFTRDFIKKFKNH